MGQVDDPRPLMPQAYGGEDMPVRGADPVPLESNA